jgi:hypothetical protein
LQEREPFSSERKENDFDDIERMEENTEKVCYKLIA